MTNFYHARVSQDSIILQRASFLLFFLLQNAALLMRGFLTLPLGGVNQGKGRVETGERGGGEHRTQ